MRWIILGLLLVFTSLQSFAGSPAKTYTFTSATTGVTFSSGNASSFPWTVTSSGITEVVRDIRVKLTSFTHTNLANLDICLVTPSGHKIMLLSDAGQDANATGAYFAGVTNQLMSWSDYYTGRGDPMTFTNSSGFGATMHPYNLNTANDSFPTPFPGFPYTGPFTTSLMAAAGVSNGTWSLYIMNDTATAGTTTTCTANQFTIEFDVVDPNIVGQNFYVSPSGSSGNTGLSPASPWPLQYAWTNRGYSTLDKMYYLPGTYTGISNYQHYVGGLVGGATNTFVWSPIAGVTNNGKDQTSWMEHLPYQGGLVKLDFRRIQIQQGPVYFHGFWLQDSSEAYRQLTDAQFISFDTADAPWTVRMEDCFIWKLGPAPGSCLYARGNIALYQGLEYHEHGVYVQSVVPAITDAQVMNNIWMFSGGSPVKLINGGYGVTTASNIIAGPGRNSTPNGYSYGIFHQPSAGYFEATPPRIFDNFLLAPSAWTAAANPDGSILTIGSGTGGTYTQFTYGGGSQIIFTNNYVLGRDDDQIALGTSSSDGYLTNSLIKYNKFIAPISARWNLRTKNTQQNATADWDYNDYISSTAPGGISWQWGDSGTTYTTLSTWTNAALGGPGTRWDIHSTVTASDSTMGGDVWRVMPTTGKPGRGHILAINNSTQTTHNFDLSTIGLTDGHKFTLLYVQSFPNQATWVTNTYTAASPNIAVNLQAANWPVTASPTSVWSPAEGAVPNALPLVGVWTIVPAPISPACSATPNGGRTQFNLSWTLPADGYGVRIYRSVNGGAYSALTTVDALTGQTYSDVGTTPASTYTYKLAAFNAFSEDAQGTASTDSGPPPPPAASSSGGLPNRGLIIVN